MRLTDTAGNSTGAELIATDTVNDLALIKTQHHWGGWARFRDSDGLKPGEPVVVTGFPLTGFVSPEMAVTTGSLTTLAGVRGDSRQIQFSAPVQPGNSGGPVLDDSGRVIGIATSILNSLVLAAATGGALPQNVNFAIKTDIAREFLAANQVTLETGRGRQALGAAGVGDVARRFTVKIECVR
jgi:S1-C subfamily serine protease